MGKEEKLSEIMATIFPGCIWWYDEDGYINHNLSYNKEYNRYKVDMETSLYHRTEIDRFIVNFVSKQMGGTMGKSLKEVIISGNSLNLEECYISLTYKFIKQ